MIVLLALALAASGEEPPSYASCTIEQDFDYKTPASTKEHCLTPDICCALCSNNTKCVAFSWELFNSKT